MSITDSTTSENWSRKTNFSELREDLIKATIRIEAAQQNEINLLEIGVNDYSQWFPETKNQVADALSWDDNRNDDKVTHILHNFCSQQVPDHINKVLLLNGIISWVTSHLQKLLQKKQLLERRMQTKLGHGEDGTNGVTRLDSNGTSSLTLSIQTRRSVCSEPMSLPLIKEDLSQKP